MEMSAFFNFMNMLLLAAILLCQPGFWVAASPFILEWQLRQAAQVLEQVK